MNGESFLFSSDVLARQICFDPAEVIAIEITLNKEGENQAPHPPPVYGIYVYLRSNVKILVCEALLCHVLDLHDYIVSLIGRDENKHLFRVTATRDCKGTILTPIISWATHKSDSKRSKSHRGGKQTDHAGG